MRKELEQWRQAKSARQSKLGKENTADKESDGVPSTPSKHLTYHPSAGTPLGELYGNTLRVAAVLPPQSPVQTKSAPQRRCGSRQASDPRAAAVSATLAALEAPREVPRAPPPSPTASYRDEPRLCWAMSPELLAPELGLVAAVTAAFAPQSSLEATPGSCSSEVAARADESSPSIRSTGAQLPVQQLLQRLEDAKVTSSPAKSPLEKKSPARAVERRREKTEIALRHTPSAAPKAPDVSEELRLKLQRARLRADREESEAKPEDEINDVPKVEEERVKVECEKPAEEADEEFKEDPLKGGKEDSEEEDEELHKQHLELLERMDKLQAEAAGIQQAASGLRPRLEEDLKARFEAATLELQELARRQSSREETAWHRRVKRHVISWPAETALDMEDHLSRAHDIFIFWFFEMRDRVSNFLSDFKPLAETLERIPEYPADWPQWRIDSAKLREEASKRRRSGAGLCDHSKPE